MPRSIRAFDDVTVLSSTDALAHIHNDGVVGHLRLSGLTLALVAAVLFGVAGVVAAGAFDVVEPLTLAQYRSVITAVILGVLVFRRRLWASVRPHLVLLTIFGLVLATVTITFYWAIERLGVGPGVTIQFMGPIGVLAWMRFIQHRPTSTTAWAAAAVAILGTGLVNRLWTITSLDPLGLAAAFAAAVTFAAYLLIGERLSRMLPSTVIVAVGFAVSAIVFTMANGVKIPVVDGGVWAQIAWVAIAGTALPFLIVTIALGRADPGRVGVVATAEPVVAAAGAWLFLGQTLDGIQIIGGLMVVAGIATLQIATGSVAPDTPDLVV